MFTDIVLPDGNETEFIKLAEKLGYGTLVFCYGKNSMKKGLADIEQLKGQTKLKLFSALVSKPNESNSIIRQADLFIVESLADNRYVFEGSKADMVVNLEADRRNDFLHSRNSGLNHVLCILARKRNIIVAFSFSEILNNLTPTFIGRVMQNIALCRKFKVSTVIASFAEKPYDMRSHHDMMAFFTVIGMHPKEAKESIIKISERIGTNQKKKNGSYIVDGAEFV